METDYFLRTPLRSASIIPAIRSHVKRRLQDSGIGTGVCEKLDLELLLRHVGLREKTPEILQQSAKPSTTEDTE